MFLELLPFAVALIIVGAISGFLAGLFGIGGGAVLVPFFYQLLGMLNVDDGLRMHISVGTSLAIIVPTSLRSYFAHRNRGSVDGELLRSFIVAVPAGVICAAIVTAYISGAGLRGIFGIISLSIAIKLLFARESWKLGKTLPDNPLRSVAGWIIGFLSTFMGIGGGVFNNTFMTAYGRPIHQSVATSSGVGILISLPGVLGYLWAGWGVQGLPEFSLGYINYLMAALVIPLTLLSAPYGVNVAHSLSKRRLELIFGLFLLVVSLRFIFSLM